MMLTRLAVGLEPLNALDAAHRSPQSAPHLQSRYLVPPLDRQLADPLSETKNWPRLSIRLRHRQDETVFSLQQLLRFWGWWCRM